MTHRTSTPTRTNNKLSKISDISPSPSDVKINVSPPLSEFGDEYDQIITNGPSVEPHSKQTRLKPIQIKNRTSLEALVDHRDVGGYLSRSSEKRMSPHLRTEIERRHRSTPTTVRRTHILEPLKNPIENPMLGFEPELKALEKKILELKNKNDSLRRIQSILEL